MCPFNIQPSLTYKWNVSDSIGDTECQFPENINSHPESVKVGELPAILSLGAAKPAVHSICVCANAENGSRSAPNHNRLRKH